MTSGPDTSFESEYHAPVLAGEVVGFLANAKSVLDGTLGGGGHSAALLDAGVPAVIGVDRDPEALAAATRRLDQFANVGRFRAVPGNFADAADGSIPELRDALFDGVLLDLGVSSRQFDVLERGFTFREGAPLDMRMNPGNSDAPTAGDVLNREDEAELTRIFKEHGDEPPPRARRLAREIIRRRETSAFATSDDLVRAIRGALGPRTGPPDFARLFQAVRIAVNDELEGLRRALPAFRDRLTPGGVIVVIAYHSGEDRVVKHTFRDWSTGCVCPPRQPTCTCGGRAMGNVLTKRAVVPGPQEISGNPRARSAKLRAWRKDDA
ncbi:MAG: 16S rRNA (cytosine(1402)-N(4))-methyltransferase RsmH [Gemmatimonadaceae bacterium]